MVEISISEAVIALTGEGNHTVEMNGEVIYDDGRTPPKPADVLAKRAELEAHYIPNRRDEYPLLGDITIALAEKAEGDSTMWDEITAKRAAVKTKWPKDNSGPVE